MKPTTFLTTLAALVLVLVTGLAGGQPPKPAPPPSKYPFDYDLMAKPDWRKGFPRLTRFEVLAPATPKGKAKRVYNCIAHSMRVYDRWVWPGSRVSDFDREYATVGLRRVKGLDFSFNPKYEKVVLYAHVKGGKIECTHGSRQLADGTWTSKLGQGPLIRHATPDSVSGPSYGRPIAVYIRLRQQPIIPPTTSSLGGSRTATTPK